MEETLKSIGNVLYGGIRPEIPGHGGEECANYLTPNQMIGETLLSTTIMVVVGALAWRALTMPKAFPRHEDLVSRRVLLASLCLLFGVEIGFKVCNRCLLYLLNPCHVITVIEVLYLYFQFSLVLITPLEFFLLTSLSRYGSWHPNQENYHSLY